MMNTLLILFLKSIDMVHIEWIVNNFKKILPLENFHSIIPMDGRSKRSRRKTNAMSYDEEGLQSPDNTSPLTQAATKKSTSTTNSPTITTQSSSRKKVSSSKKRKGSPNQNKKPKPDLQVITYDKPIDVIVRRSHQPQNFLRAMFGNNLHIIEQELPAGRDCDIYSHTLDEEIDFYGVEYNLVVCKEKDRLGTKLHFLEKSACVAYYLGGDGFATKDDVKDKLDSFGNLSLLAVNRAKLCSRLELLVSPACSKYNGVYCMKDDEFEVIEEDQHVGTFNLLC